MLKPRGLPLLFLDYFKNLFHLPQLQPTDPLATAELPRSGPVIYPRAEHCISRSQVNDNALKVLYRLQKSGYSAYLVGGCVRDLLLGREPKDFDVVTDAHPEEIRSIFRNCRLIGRRFRLVHVHFGDEIVEVATFRALSGDDSSSQRVSSNGRILRDNVYGTIEEDAFRRDFTINALYYNIYNFSVVDYVGGMEDHKASVLRLIGEPENRYREDPVRMLRAVRFAVKLGFTIHPSCADLMPRLAHLLEEIPAARLYDEVLKLFLTGYAVQTFEQLRHYRLFGSLFPATERCLAREQEGFPLTFLAKALENTDQRIQEGKPVAPFFLFAVLLWEPARQAVEAALAKGVQESLAYQEAAGIVFTRQVHSTAIPRTVSQPAREIWMLQPRFECTQGPRPFRLLGHPRFRPAYDFLMLRAVTGEAEIGLAEWWTRFQSAPEAEQKTMSRTGWKQGGSQGRSRRRRRPRSKARKPDAPST